VINDEVRVIRRRFPGLVFWRGVHTGTWWALIPPPAGWRLVEASDPEELTQAVVNARSWPWPSGTAWSRLVPVKP
jgi:hypothetical protein